MNSKREVPKQPVDHCRDPKPKIDLKEKNSRKQFANDYVKCFRKGCRQSISSWGESNGFDIGDQLLNLKSAVGENLRKEEKKLWRKCERGQCSNSGGVHSSKTSNSRKTNASLP